MTAVSSATSSSPNHGATTPISKIAVVIAAVCAAAASIFLLPAKVTAIVIPVLIGGVGSYLFWNVCRMIDWSNTISQSASAIATRVRNSHPHVTVEGGHNQRAPMQPTGTPGRAPVGQRNQTPTRPAPPDERHVRPGQGHQTQTSDGRVRVGQ